ncbi:MAG: hypothetical protein AAF806_29790 [Bacteroidota bacterium]
MKQFFYLPLLLFLLTCKPPQRLAIQDPITAPIPMCAPPTDDRNWYQSDEVAPLFEGLDAIDFPITTNKELVQRYFEQGMVLAHGFNHAEAARSFYYAIKLDSTCAMAHWGYAYVLGPNYNSGMKAKNYPLAHEAIQKAIQFAEELGTDKEKALTKALAKRYVAEAVEDRKSLDEDYAKAMEELFKTYPKDANIGTLYVESLMNLHPWNLYDKDGNPKEWTPKILTALDEVFAIDPKHPGAHHFHIHAVEASKTPEKGLISAAIFDEDLVPGAGHLVHMPSHIYIRTGDYHKGTLANIRAVQADSSYVTACRAQGAYPLIYYPHNWHFLSATATLSGNSEWGIKAAEFVSKHTKNGLMPSKDWGILQHFYSIPYYIYVKFGKWDDILNKELEAPSLKYPRAVQHYARGMAYLGKRKIKDAQLELKKLKQLVIDEEIQQIKMGGNSIESILQIAEKVLEGELEASKGNYESSIRLLKEGVVLEDALSYIEPPDWFFSVRHHLGAVQIEAGQHEVALSTYLEDLDKLPKNGWALHGMKQAYAAMGKGIEQAATEEQLKSIWGEADIKITSSRIK